MRPWPRDRIAAAVAFALLPVPLLARPLLRLPGRTEGHVTQELIPYTSSLSGTYLGAAIMRLSGWPGR